MCRTFLYSFCIHFYSENLKILRNLVYWPWGKLFGSRKTLSEAACSEQLPISKPIIFWESLGQDWTIVKFSAKSIYYDSHYSASFQQILNRNPYHIDSMLQLSEICKMGEDSQMATELIERTLFAMEAAFHPLFNLSVGISRWSIF